MSYHQMMMVFKDDYSGIFRHTSSCWCYQDDALCCTMAMYFGTDSVPVAHSLHYQPNTLPFSHLLPFAALLPLLWYGSLPLNLFGSLLAWLLKYLYFNVAGILSHQGCLQPAGHLLFLIQVRQNSHPNLLLFWKMTVLRGIRLVRRGDTAA